MARVTVEDCLKNVKNRFELVLIASKRARQLMRGKDALVEWDNDKATVVALREIAAGHTNFDHTDKEVEHDPFRGFVEQKTVATEIVVEEDEIDAADESLDEDENIGNTAVEPGEMTEENQTPSSREE